MNEENQRVICDTTVWYKVSEGEFDISKLENFRSTATWLNFVELYTSPELGKDVIRVQRAMKALDDSRTQVLGLSPIRYLIDLQNPSFEENSKYDEFNAIYYQMKEFIQTPLNQIPSTKMEQLKHQHTLTSKGHREDFKMGALEANEALLQIQKINRQKKKVGILEEVTQDMSKDFICEIVKNVTNGNVIIDKKSYPWDKIELFLLLLTNEVRKLEIVSEMKLKKNNWFDLWSTVYVRPGDLYLTQDEIWKGKVKEVPQAISYLFESV